MNKDTIVRYAPVNRDVYETAKRLGYESTAELFIAVGIWLYARPKSVREWTLKEILVQFVASETKRKNSNA